MKTKDILVYLIFAYCILEIINFKDLHLLDYCVLVVGGVLAVLKIIDFTGETHG